MHVLLLWCGVCWCEYELVLISSRRRLRPNKRNVCCVQVLQEREREWVIKSLISKKTPSIYSVHLSRDCQKPRVCVCVWERERMCINAPHSNKIYWYGVLLAVFPRCKFRRVISGINLLIRHFGKTASGRQGVSNPLDWAQMSSSSQWNCVSRVEHPVSCNAAVGVWKPHHGAN